MVRPRALSHLINYFGSEEGLFGLYTRGAMVSHLIDYLGLGMELGPGRSCGGTGAVNFPGREKDTGAMGAVQTR